ncbi:bifunctional hydroxymethylpyrimidine kinase/phosphomethylpyrimidine kinase [Oenococcus alcoholitolerans]|uniref:bifunctional hydroxymethylpyrimidine kinase/phosphomethylpyrimidine kinase n=1 Tax=Oenococcus alcoholitolerans TaxID=931074 RepID=UPI003F6EBBC1
MIQYPQTLTIAGTDSGGGAGIQADIKTMQSCQVFSTNITIAVTAQNTLGVQAAFGLPLEMIDKQFSSIFQDFEIKAAKTGMLFDREHLLKTVENIEKFKIKNLVVDPVMVAKGGARLLTQDAVKAMIEKLLPLALVVTPNLPEAEVIAGFKIDSKEKTIAAAKTIAKSGAKNVLIKGGHQDSDLIYDYVLLENGDSYWLKAQRYHTIRTHGTGDTLSSAITSALAKGYSVRAAIDFGKKFVDKAIQETILVGHGHGPLNHWAAAEIGHEI